MSNHTPGPWIARMNCDVMAGERLVADCMSGWPRENRANAHLICTAPDLYHELEDSVRLMCNNCNTCELDTNGKPMFESQVCETYTRKVAVLNKARGE